MKTNMDLRNRTLAILLAAAGIVVAALPADAAGAVQTASSASGIPEWREFTAGQTLGQGTPLTEGGSSACHFDGAQGAITFLPEEAEAIREAGVAVTRVLRLELTPDCGLVVASSTQTVEPLPESVPTPPVNVPGQVEVGVDTSGEVGAEAVCPKVEGIVTYRPFYGGPDYLTETRAQADYCYTGSSTSISTGHYWCKANGGHAFLLDACTRTSVQWSGWEAWYERQGDYHQFCCQFDHWSKMKIYTRGDGLVQCQWAVGGSTPRDNPEIACRYV